jgi:hypothetical protein
MENVDESLLLIDDVGDSSSMFLGEWVSIIVVPLTFGSNSATPPTLGGYDTKRPGDGEKSEIRSDRALSRCSLDKTWSESFARSILCMLEEERQ